VHADRGRGRPLDRVGAVLHGLAGFGGGRFDRIAIGDGGVEPVGKVDRSLVGDFELHRDDRRYGLLDQRLGGAGVWVGEAGAGPLAGIDHIAAQRAVVRQPCANVLRLHLLTASMRTLEHQRPVIRAFVLEAAAHIVEDVIVLPAQLLLQRG
jgi:hypothetical protein